MLCVVRSIKERSAASLMALFSKVLDRCIPKALSSMMLPSKCLPKPPLRAIQVATMLELRGAPALSPFRFNKLHACLKDSVPEVDHVYAEFMHFADLDGYCWEVAWGPRDEFDDNDMLVL